LEAASGPARPACDAARGRRAAAPGQDVYALHKGVDARDPTSRRREAQMHYRLLADLVVLLHLAFIVFVVAGGFLALRWGWLAAVHVPCALWGALIEFCGWYCPLTPLENWLRRATGEEAYAGGFIEHYLLPLVYPGAITRGMQIGLGIAVLSINALAYSIVWLRHAGRL
jgi:hypothetical protein